MGYDYSVEAEFKISPNITDDNIVELIDKYNDFCDRFNFEENQFSLRDYSNNQSGLNYKNILSEIAQTLVGFEVKKIEGRAYYYGEKYLVDHGFYQFNEDLNVDNYKMYIEFIPINSLEIEGIAPTLYNISDKLGDFYIDMSNELKTDSLENYIFDTFYDIKNGGLTKNKHLFLHFSDINDMERSTYCIEWNNGKMNYYKGIPGYKKS